MGKIRTRSLLDVIAELKVEVRSLKRKVASLKAELRQENRAKNTGSKKPGRAPL
jgi:hypothetical protein